MSTPSLDGLISSEMLEAGAVEALVFEVDYPRQQIARDVFVAMLECALQSEREASAYAELFRESARQHAANRSS